MDVLAAIRAGTASVVIIDDLFAPPNFDHIPAENRHELIDRLEAVAADKASLQALLDAQDVDDEAALAQRASEDAPRLWTLYTDDPQAHSYLQALFGSFEAQHAEVVRLRSLVKILTDFFGREPAVFASLQAAQEELSRCAIAFVDLFIGVPQTIEEILELHAAYKPQYQEAFRHEERAWPKLIVLISTRLPANEQLKSFRRGAGVRTAFFKPLEKNKISQDEIARILESWSIKYAAAANLNRYLNDLTTIVHQSATQVAQDIDQLELHDLAVLDAARLLGDGASLHSYISWLTAELLASRVRVSTAKITDEAPKRAAEGAVDPMLVGESALFDLFADVASTPPEVDGAPQFGEILAPAGHVGANQVPVLVALSPACDLARCAADYEVLLLRGVMKPSGRNATELLKLGAVFGKGSHLLNFRVNNELRQGIIQWDTKQGLVTRPAGELANPDKYTRLGRMAELFAYEVKEMAISQVSRVGLPVAPTVQKAASVRVRARFDMGLGVARIEFNEAAPGAPTVCALVARGRIGEGDSEADLVLLTEQFRVWFNQAIIPKLSAGAGNGKIDSLLANLSRWGDWRVAIEDKTGKPFNDLVIRLDPQAVDAAARSLEIIITPQ